MGKSYKRGKNQNELEISPLTFPPFILLSGDTFIKLTFGYISSAIEFYQNGELGFSSFQVEKK